MKNSFALAFACASISLFSLGIEDALGQQAQYQPAMPGQYMPGDPASQQYAAAQQYAQAQYQAQYQAQRDQEEQAARSRSKARRASEPSDYEIQEQAIQKGLAESKAGSHSPESYSQEMPSTWSSQPSPGRGAKLKGAAVVAGKMLGKTAAVALPTVGMVFLARAINRNSAGVNMNSGLGTGNYYNNGYGYGYGYGSNPLGIAGRSLNPLGGFYSGR